MFNPFSAWRDLNLHLSISKESFRAAVLEGPFPAVSFQLVPPAQVSGIAGHRVQLGCPSHLATAQPPKPALAPLPLPWGSVRAEMLCFWNSGEVLVGQTTLSYTTPKCLRCIHNQSTEVILGLGMDAGRQDVSPSLFHTILPGPSPRKWEVSWY